MKKNSNFLDKEAYFQYFEKKYTHPLFNQKYPLISKRMKMLCGMIKEKIQHASSINFFEVHAEVLGLDAQLQILLFLLEFVDNNSEFSEEIAIKCSQEDYQIFMKELCGNDSKEFLDYTLYFSVI
ncbi:DUF7006 family protein [Enterococcus mundtii]|uniref:DUF7006 family protein n=1 Tax=Enterococcus mundtii TaxID=53346 RepID=UPI000CF066DD|nr:hypothetical protein [Enterococcus mundtii]PQC29567.1 hypothetical protein CUM97_11140 [Enterococcus mundtii]